MTELQTATPLKVLLIDDDDDQFVLTREFLTDDPEQSFDLHWAPTFDDGVNRLATADYDAVLIDYRLGAHDGLELLRSGIAQRAGVPAIMLTGADDADVDAEAMASGAVEYLVKSEVTAPMLRRAVRYAAARKKADDLEGRLAAIVESSTDAIFSLTLNCVVATWNAGAAQVFGYSPAEAIGKHVSLLIATDPDTHVCARLTEVCASGCTLQLEIDVTGKGGQSIPVSLTMSPLRNPEGAVTGASVVARDVTERKRFEAALIESEAEYRATFDEAPVGIAHTSLEGHWLRVNRRLCSMLGCTAEALGNTTVAEMTHPDDRNQMAEGRRQLLTGELTHYVADKRYRRADGSYFLGHVTVSLRRDDEGQPIHFIAIVEDISQLRQTRNELDHIFNLSPDLLCTASFEGYFARANAMWSEILGYPQEQLQARPFLEFVHPDDRAATSEIVGRLEEGQTVVAFTNRYRAADGSYRWLEWNAKADLSRRVIYAVARDQSERRLLEEQLRQAQKMEAVGRLAGGVAHDFNNLLTAIIGFSQMTLETLSPDAPTRGDVEQILAAGKSAAALTRSLLAFSRKQVLDPKIIDMNVTVGSVDGLLRRVIGEDVELLTEVGDEPCLVNADKSQVEQVLMNLAVNARDAMPCGGSLRIAIAPVDLDPAFVATHPGSAAGPYVRITVSDTGTGMTPDVLSHVFEPFFTTKEQGKGTGLGLATVYGIVKQSGGYIWVDSTPGMGTSFMIALPRVSAASARTGERAGDHGVVTGTETVLLVEDQPEVRRVARRALERHGYTVIEATDGNIALEMLRGSQDRIHLLLTDLVMPTMSGRELAQLVTGYAPSIRVLYMSGYADKAIVRDGTLDAGVNFIAKPFTPHQLLARIRQVLDQTNAA